MRVVMAGTGGAGGWPEPGCPCASCAGASARGRARAPSAVVVDGIVRLPPRDSRPPDAGGHAVRAVPGGWDVTGPDGQRLLCASASGAIPEPPPDAGPYDYAVLDMLPDPAQLGLLRRRGLVTDETSVTLAWVDHRVASEREMAELCGFWNVRLTADGEAVSHHRYARSRGRVLVIGGARSGKSERAELRVAAEPDVTYVATGSDGAESGEWKERVAAHQARRPGWWRTVETTDLVTMLNGPGGTLLIDGIGTWLAAAMDECGIWDGATGADNRLTARIAELVRAWRETREHVVAVSDETGFGIVPETFAGRRFRDELGRLNQALTRESEVTEFVVAGRVLPLPLW